MKSLDKHNRLTKKQQIGQCLHPAAFIHDTPEGIELIEKYICDYQVGGLTFFYSREVVETNFNRDKVFEPEKGSTERLADLIAHYQKLSKIPLLISIDAEWGLGMRISEQNSYPYPMTLAATHDPEDCYKVGLAIAKELCEVGINFNLAPVVDVNSNRLNPVIGYRSFGSDPERVYECAKAYYNGMKAEEIIGCLKHFPGHGDTQTDSHLALPVINKQLEDLRSNELVPFKRLIEDGLVDCIMSGHIVLAQLDTFPCSLSNQILQGVLRDELDYQGVIMTDALNMRSVFEKDQAGKLEYQAFLAGNDILSFSMNLEGALAMIDEKVSIERVEESFDRIMDLKMRSNLSRSRMNSRVVPDSSQLRQSIARKTITIVKCHEEKDPNTSTSIVWVGKDPATSMFKSTVQLANEFSLEDICENKLQIQGERLVLAVYPLSNKPKRFYGLEEFILKEVHKLADHFYTELYLFGNPYSLEMFNLDKFKKVVLAYQDLPEFEEAAAEHLSGDLEAEGQLPVDNIPFK